MLFKVQDICSGSNVIFREVVKHEYNGKWIKLLHLTESNSTKNCRNHCLLPDPCFSLIGNSFMGTVVYKTQTLRKPINYFIVNMVVSDLLVTIFWFPKELSQLYEDNEWLISGPLGQALCKLVHFITNVSSDVSIQSLVLIAVDRFGVVVFPLCSPLISSKLCPFFIVATVDRRDGRRLVKFSRHETG